MAAFTIPVVFALLGLALMTIGFAIIWTPLAYLIPGALLLFVAAWSALPATPRGAPRR